MKFLKAFWLRLSSPSKAAVGVVLLMGFVGGLLFWGAFNTGMEATNSEEFCSGCHAPIVAEIQETIHYSNRSGVRAICSDCHVPHEWTDKIVRKVQASKELVAHFIGTIDTPEKFQARRAHLAEREWARLKRTIRWNVETVTSSTTWISLSRVAEQRSNTRPHSPLVKKPVWIAIKASHTISPTCMVLKAGNKESHYEYS